MACRNRGRGIDTCVNKAATKKQPDPKGSGAPITDLVIADLLERKEFGTAKYGEPLRAFNGRDPLIDLYQELIDAVMYVRQQIEEDKESEIGQLRKLIEVLAEHAWQDEVISTHMYDLEIGEGKTYADKEDWIETWFAGMIEFGDLPEGLISDA